MSICPVCQANVNAAWAARQANWKGKVYHFCSESCHESFQAQPARYAGGNWWQRFVRALQRENRRQFGNNPPSCH